MTRITWDRLPELIRTEIERIAGAAVVEAVSQPGGFSPGSADRLLLSDGRRVFAKAVSTDLNPDSPGIHRREIAVTSALPPSAPAPRLLGSVDQDGWVALVLEDVAGRHPALPWSREELLGCLKALEHLASSCTPNPVPGLPAAPDEVAGLFAGWERVAADSRGVAPEILDKLNDLRELASAAVGLVAGDTLVHLDVRDDNLLIGDDGRVRIIDWPWACVGCDWFDSLALLLAATQAGTPGFSLDAVIADVPLLARVPAPHLDSVLAALAGFLVDIGRLPAPPGLPTLREFQARMGSAALAWLERRLAR